MLTIVPRPRPASVADTAFTGRALCTLRNRDAVVIRHRHDVCRHLRTLRCHRLDQGQSLVLPHGLGQPRAAAVRDPLEIEETPLRFHSGAKVRGQRCRMLRTEGHPSARSSEELVQQRGADARSTCVWRDEEIGQHRDTIDVDRATECHERDHHARPRASARVVIAPGRGSSHPPRRRRPWRSHPLRCRPRRTLL